MVLLISVPLTQPVRHSAGHLIRGDILPHPRCWAWGGKVWMREVRLVRSSYFPRMGISKRVRRSLNPIRYNTGQIPALRPRGHRPPVHCGSTAPEAEIIPHPAPSRPQTDEAALISNNRHLQLRGVRGFQSWDNYLFWLQLGSPGSSLSYLKCGNHYPASAKPTKLG